MQNLSGLNYKKYVNDKDNLSHLSNICQSLSQLLFRITF